MSDIFIDRLFPDSCGECTVKGITQKLHRIYPSINPGKVYYAISHFLRHPEYRALMAPLPGHGRAYRYRPAAARLIAHYLTEGLDALPADDPRQFVTKHDGHDETDLLLRSKEREIVGLQEEIKRLRDEAVDLRRLLVLGRDREATLERLVFERDEMIKQLERTIEQQMVKAAQCQFSSVVECWSDAGAKYPTIPLLPDAQ